MRRVLVVGCTASAAIVACFSKPPAPGEHPGDGGPADARGSDAAIACTPDGVTCSNDMLVTCAGGFATQTACGWGCSTSGSARCLALVPAGSTVTASDFNSPGASDMTLGNGVTINSSTGAITDVNGPVSGFNTRPAPNVMVFQFKSLHVTAAVSVIGNRSVVLVADGPITIDGVLDATTGCSSGSFIAPGGFEGGFAGSNATGSGSGAGGTQNSKGGGGGGNGGSGGAGGATSGPAAGGAMCGDPAITVLFGGGGGGGGGGTNGGKGGGGGAGMQLVSNTAIAISGGAGINAGGCGGQPTAASGPGGGGGAGGTILLEAPTISIDASAVLAVNGGGGAGGDSTSGSGETGHPNRTAAAGGTAMFSGFGGSGAAAATSIGSAGVSASSSGGGGGGIGRIRIETRGGFAAIDGNAILSPALSDSTTATQGSAVTR